MKMLGISALQKTNFRYWLNRHIFIMLLDKLALNALMQKGLRKNG
jgi:hypothetical protein